MSKDSGPLNRLMDTNQNGWPAPPGPQRPPGRSTEQRRRGRFLVLVIVVALVGVGAVVLLPHLHHTPAQSPIAAPSPTTSVTVAPTTAAPTPAPTPTEKLPPSKPKLALASTLTAPGPVGSLPWPTSGQAEVEVAGLGVLGHSGTGRAVPIASVAKVMTAYTVLRDHPLSAGQSGPTIVVTPAEAAAYPAQKAALDSLVVVSAGEKISEQDALKGLLIASGDNMAEILARWDAGSLPAFARRMNQNAARLGMSNTHYADPHGLSTATVSTAADQVKLAPAAMAQPALAQLVGTRSASIPLNQTITNYNSLLGRHGVYGIKTGSTTAAGGCLLFAARTSVAGRLATVYGAVLAISGDRGSILSNARDAGDALVVGAGQTLHRVTLVHAGTPVVTLIAKNGRTEELTVADDLTVSGWSGQKFGFALPGPLHTGRPPSKLIVHTPTSTLTVPLVKI